ncbi:MAG: endonuclease/exonuclease/phosphatase family protein [Bergeyella cardium]
MRRLLLVGHISTALVLSATVLNAYISPVVNAWLNFFSLVFPVVLVVYFVLCALWIFIRWRYAVFFLCLSFVFINPIKRWVNFSSKSHQSSDIKVMSFNVHNGFYGEKEIAEYINTENPDLIFLQEASFLGEKEYHFSDLKFKYQADYCVILSKFPIQSEGLLNISRHGYIGKAIYADVDCHGQRLRLVNYYLEPFQLSDSERQAENISGSYLEKFLFTFKEHAGQADALQSSIKASPYPLLVAGDMNAVPNSYEYYTISRGLTDAFQSAGRGIGISFREVIMPIKIDYIFSSEGIEPLSCHIAKTRNLSDHQPIIAEFSLR